MPGRVEVTVADAHWDELVNVLGNWANWSDQKAVFSGRLNETALRKALEQAFFAWYQGALNSSSQ